MKLISTKTIVTLGIGSAGLIGATYAPNTKLKGTLMLAGVSGLGLGLAFLLNDVKDNLAEFQSEGGILGTLGGLIFGDKPESTETGSSGPVATQGESVLSGSFDNEGDAIIPPFTGKTYRMQFSVRYTGAPTKMAFTLKAKEQGLYGTYSQELTTDVYDFPGDGSKKHFEVNMPTATWIIDGVSSVVTLYSSIQPQALATGLYLLKSF